MPGTQLEVLTALDKAKTQWYHMTAIVIAGMGFFTDAYDLFCITTLSRLLGRIYYASDYTQPKPSKLPPGVDGAVNGVALVGTVVGQIFFGWMGDKLGRKNVYGITLLIMIISSIGSGLSFGHRRHAVMVSLCFFRFWLGFGIGGDYPLSATIMSEYANKRTRGAFIAAVFAMQGVGLLTAAVVAMTVSQIFIAITGPQYHYNQGPASVPWEADYVWRIVFMFGAIPAAATFYWRMQMPETARYTALVAGKAKQAAEDMSKVLALEIAAEQNKVDKIMQSEAYSLWSMEFLKKHGLHLLGTASTWLLLDIAFYSQNLFQKDLFTDVGWLKQPQHMSALEEVRKIAQAQALLALFSTVPGYWVTVVLIDNLGRFVIQLQGFFFMSLFLLIIGKEFYVFRGDKCSSQTGYCNGNPVAFVAFYALIFFFSNFGPNSTTFIVPAELFPARFRATCHGISAAAGKVGAIIGAFGFLRIAQGRRDDPRDIDSGYSPGLGPNNALIILACTNALGFFFTFLVPETMGKSLEDISGESEDVPGDSLSYTRQVRSGTGATEEAP